MKDWVDLLNSLCKEDEFQYIETYLNKLEKEGVPFYPARENIFKAFNLCPFNRFQVVWLGQDPYHNGQATGICMGVNSSPVPPTLSMLNESLQEEYQTSIENNNLEHWAKQGVLLLNSALTVQKASPGSHTALWSRFMRILLQRIVFLKKDIIWVGLGTYSRDIINSLKGIEDKNKVIAPHPMHAIYSGNKRKFLDHKVFTQINDKLKNNNNNIISF